MELAEMEALATKLERQLAEGQSHTTDPRNPDPKKVLGDGKAPAVRKGENVLTSRGFSVLRACGLAAGKIDPSNAKVEIGVHNHVMKHFRQHMNSELIPNRGQMLVPWGSEMFPEEMDTPEGVVQLEGAREFGQVLKSLLYRGVENADPDEVEHLRKSYYAPVRKDMSWIDISKGGAWVGPPEVGEPIELLRNKLALVTAGARTISLPPSGRLEFARRTAATRAYFVGENTAGTISEPGTGLLRLMAKKCMGITPVPNELFRFSTPSAEAIIRDDLTTSVALAFDYAGIYGPGSDTVPQGIIETPGVQVHVATTVAANGDTLGSDDPFEMIGKIENANGTFEAWLMRPSMYFKLLTRRVDAVAASDAAGAFLFSPTRGMQEGLVGGFVGYPAVRTPQVNALRVKGAGTTLTTIFGGMFSQVLVAMWGGMIIDLNPYGSTQFRQDQTEIRVIGHGDTGVRIPGALVYCDTLVEA